MFETIFTLNTHKNPPSLTLRFTVRPARSSQVKAMDVDGYGDYDTDLIGELLAAAPAHQSRINPRVSSEELDRYYQTFLS